MLGRLIERTTSLPPTSQRRGRAASALDDSADKVLLRIQTWALEEARRRLEKEGILDDPDM